MSENDVVLRAEGLKKYYPTEDGFLDKVFGESGWVKALDGVDLQIREGETLGIVGESGCGKSTLGRTLLQLEEPTDGTVHYREENLVEATGDRLQAARTDLQMIFQNPFASLNPRFTVADIIGEPLDIHGIASGSQRDKRISELLEEVGLSRSHANRYPHEFSGGQLQRIGIARALAVDPELIVCDEPVSALDVSVQAQILNLLKSLQKEYGLSYIFIAHDLSVVEHISDRIGVMYLGKLVEKGTTEEIFAEPHHPYTEALLSAIPEPNPRWEHDRILLKGTVPSPIDPPSGCSFHTRCPRVIQPEGYEFEQPNWRAILTLRTRLEAEDASMRSVLSAHKASDEAIDPETIPAQLREAYDLPEQLTDPEADRVLQSAVDHMVNDEIGLAADVLAQAFSTPCESETPELITKEQHPIACHLYSEAYSDQVDTELGW